MALGVHLCILPAVSRGLDVPGAAQGDHAARSGPRCAPPRLGAATPDPALLGAPHPPESGSLRKGGWKRGTQGARFCFIWGVGVGGGGDLSI